MTRNLGARPEILLFGHFLTTSADRATAVETSTIVVKIISIVLIWGILDNEIMYLLILTVLQDAALIPADFEHIRGLCFKGNMTWGVSYRRKSEWIQACGRPPGHKDPA